MPAGTKINKGASNKEIILDAAAKLISELGFERTSIRNIIDESGLKAGSIYYLFESKDQILIEIQKRGFGLMSAAVQKAIDEAEADEPWGKLQAACAAHLETMFKHRPYIEVTVRELPDRHPKKSRRQMLALRSKYEEIFAQLIDDLPLQERIDRSLFRLTLLGSLAWTLVWFHAEGDKSPKEITDQMVDFFRKSSEI